MSMKTKVLSVLAIAVIFVACNTNNPEKEQQLLGYWIEHVDDSTAVKTFTFSADGIVIYHVDEPKEGIWVFTYPLPYKELKYSVKNNKLQFEGNTSNIPGDPDGKTFSFVTDYTLNDTVLAIDSFSYMGEYGRFMKNLVLYKYEPAGGFDGDK